MLLFFIVIAYILGANLYLFFPLIFIPLSLVFFVIAFRRFHLRGFILCFSSFMVAVIISSIFNNIEPHRDYYEGVVIEAKDNYYLFSSFPYRFYIYEKNNDIEVGDILAFNDTPKRINKTTYESQFDFNAYLKGKNVRYSLSSYKKKVIFKSGFNIKKVRQEFLANFNEETADAIDSLLFGNAHYNSSINSVADDINIIYLFNMSGIYISFLLRGLKKISRKVIKNEKVADIIPLVILLPYMPFILLKIGCVRSLITYLFRYINHYFFHQRFLKIEVTSLSGAVLLLNYTNAYQTGFYLGFFLSAFIFFLGELMKHFKKYKYSFLLMPFYIYFFMLPLSTLNNGELHLFQLLFQNLLLPINEIYLLTSLISFYTVPFTNTLNFMSKVLFNSYSYLSYIDIGLNLGEFNVYLISLYYVIYLSIIYNLEVVKEEKYKSLTLVLVLIFFYKAIPIEPYLLNAIYFINVGQGDSILIVNHNKNILIDTGGSTYFEMGEETLLPFFRKKQIDHLDLLITTHDDFDHSGAVPYLLSNFRVNKYLKERDDFPIKVGDIYLENLNDMEASDENESSLVFKLDFMNKSFLLMGDADVKVEKYLLKKYPDLDCDILKAGHHGSDTSTCEEFVKQITPKEAIISCASENYYGHPKASVIETLTKYNVKIRYTMKEGTISYISL